VPPGRPRKHDRERHAELQELVCWFERQAEFSNPRSLLSASARRGFPLPKNGVYEFFRRERLLDWQTTALMAEALGQEAGAVRELWQRARQSMRTKQPPSQAGVASWDDLPVPEGWLRELLIGQRDAPDRFPYRLLDVSPPLLSEVYVEQDVQPAVTRGSHDGSVEKHPRAAPPAVGQSLRQVLGEHDHLFITGGPGTGKTTLGRHLTRQIAQAWLSELGDEVPWCAEPVVGVRITAADVLAAHSWAEALVSASWASVLTKPIDPRIFGGRSHGTRWLVVVDGLDEVASPQNREIVLRALAARVEHGSAYRLVITSRPLPQEELEPFQARSVGFYTLSGFDGVQQRAFAERWFAAQKMADPAKAVTAFLEEVKNAGLTELIKVPLFATIAATFYTRKPRRSLPRGRIELYEKFLEELSDVRSHRVDIRGRLRVRWDELGCAGTMDWILANQERLRLHLAQVETGRQPLTLDSAVGWLREQLPDGLRLRDGMEGDLGRLLAETGVLVFDGTELSFLHRSFAEFIAARQEAAGIPAEFPGLVTWMERVQAETSRNYVFFTLAHWARRQGNDASTVVRLLLAENLQYRVMALRLVTAGVPMGAELEGAVIDRVLSEPFESRGRGYSRPDHELFTELTELRGNERLAELLQRLSGTHGLPIAFRASAAAAYARVADLPGGVRLLHELANQVDGPEGLIGIVRHLAVLDAPATEARIRLLRRAVDGDKPWWRVQAMWELIELGENEGAVELARFVLGGGEQNGSLLESAGDIWLAVEGESAAPEIVRVIADRKRNNEWAHAGLAKLLFYAGDTVAAEPHAREVLLNSVADDDIQEVIEAWIEVEGAGGAGKIIAVFDGFINWNTDVRSHVARQLLELGHPEAAVELARRILGGPDKPSSYDASWAVEVLLSALGESVVEEALHWLDEHSVEPGKLHMLTQQMIDEGFAAAACVLARRTMNFAGVTEETFTWAADILLIHVGSKAGEEITQMLRARPMGSTTLTAALLPVLSKHQQKEATVALCREVFFDPGRTVDELLKAVRAWILVAGPESVPQIMSLIEAVCGLSGDERARLAGLLKAEGEADAAVSLWCAVSVQPTLSSELRWRAVEQLLDVGAAEKAATTLKAALATTSDEVESVRLRQLLGWVNPASS
jgi:hypothetical protein